jgi:hypothetical protein
LAFHAFQTPSFPWHALETRFAKSQSPRKPVVGTGTICPTSRPHVQVDCRCKMCPLAFLDPWTRYLSSLAFSVISPAVFRIDSGRRYRRDFEVNAYPFVEKGGSPETRRRSSSYQRPRRREAVTIQWLSFRRYWAVAVFPESARRTVALPARSVPGAPVGCCAHFPSR